MDKPPILVVGSINMDLVVRCSQMPNPGETCLGEGFVTSPGGKGANQAVAAARLGGQVRLVGRVGNDDFGKSLLTNLVAEGIDCNHVMRTDGSPTGVAMIVVDAQGENAIVVASGANHRLTPDDVFMRDALFAEARVVLLQLELPLPTVRSAIQLARKHDCRVILDPAPAPARMPDELFEVDILSPNAVESEQLLGSPAIEERVDKLRALGLIAKGARAAVLKLGARGSMVVMADGHFYKVPPYKVRVVDATAAGDAFTAALAVSVARGEKMHAAARFANAAGALACTKLGAQTAMPTVTEVRMLMEDQEPTNGN